MGGLRVQCSTRGMRGGPGGCSQRPGPPAAARRATGPTRPTGATGPTGHVPASGRCCCLGPARPPAGAGSAAAPARGQAGAGWWPAPVPACRWRPARRRQCWAPQGAPSPRAGGPPSPPTLGPCPGRWSPRWSRPGAPARWETGTAPARWGATAVAAPPRRSMRAWPRGPEAAAASARTKGRRAAAAAPAAWSPCLGSRGGPPTSAVPIHAW
jgi:hypothetical protein